MALLNAETVLHDRWGGAEFWKARRSMRFNEYLVNTAQTFRSTVLNSTDQNDATQRPKDWRLEVVRLLTKTVIVFLNCVNKLNFRPHWFCE